MFACPHITPQCPHRHADIIRSHRVVASHLVFHLALLPAFFFIVMKYNSFSPPGPPEPDVYTLAVPSGGLEECNMLFSSNNTKCTVHQNKTKKKKKNKKTRPVAFTSLPFLLPVILSFLFSLVKRLHASRFPTHNAVQGGRLFEL